MRQVQAHIDEAEQARGEWPLRHAVRYRRYLADPTLRPPGPWPDAPRLFVDTTRVVFERLHAELWEALFGQEKSIELVPYNEEAVGKLETSSAFLEWAMQRTIDFAKVSSNLLFDTLLDSAGVGKVAVFRPPWKPPSAQSTRYLSRWVTIDALDLGMLGVPPDAEGLQYPEARYVWQEFFISLDDVARMKARRDTRFQVPDRDKLDYSQELTERKRVELEREGARPEPFRPDSIRFVESYERFDVDGDGLDEDVIVSWFPDAQSDGNAGGPRGFLANVRLLTEVYPQEDRPRRPFFETTVWAQPRQWRGLNVPDRLESMQDLINRLHEQMINFADVSMLPYVFANTFLTGTMPDLRSVRPGSVITIDDVTGVQFAPTRSLNRHFAEQISLAGANIERSSGVSDFTLGRSPDRPNVPRTASATLALLQEGRRAFSMVAKRVAKQFEAMLNFYFQLWQVTIPPELTARIMPAGVGQGQGQGQSSVFGLQSSAEDCRPKTDDCP